MQSNLEKLTKVFDKRNGKYGMADLETYYATMPPKYKIHYDDGNFGYARWEDLHIIKEDSKGNRRKWGGK